MWLLAGAQWAGFKHIAWLRAGGWRAFRTRTFAFAAWTGMDAAAFLERGEARRIPWFGGIVSAVLGAILMWVVIPTIEPTVLRGWLGMIALLLILHFGIFEVLAAFLNRLGFHVRPIMDEPWKARSLTEFWSDRWNRAFSDIGSVTVFRPLVRRFGIRIGTLAGFAFSGLAHELVISVPAGGGYGLPTLYFLIQGVGALTERRFKFRGKPIARWWTFAVVLAPAFWLFHPPFMTHVINPFLNFLTP
jgi:alginate O-acetyltransferase complex protein AlgI